jgi:hypothetical protein
VFLKSGEELIKAFHKKVPTQPSLKMKKRAEMGEILTDIKIRSISEHLLWQNHIM